MNLKQTPINDLSLPHDACEKLQALGVQTAYDLVLFAYFEGQRQLLAKHLDLSRDKFDVVFDKLLSYAPIEAIERIACRAREIRNIPTGLLPPDDEGPGESPDDQVGPQGPETGENGQNESDRLTPPEEFGGHDGS